MSGRRGEWLILVSAGRWVFRWSWLGGVWVEISRMELDFT